MPVTSGNFGELLEPGLIEVFGLAYKQYDPEYSKVFKVVGSERAFEETLSLKTFGLLPEKSKGASVTYENAMQGFKTRFDHTTFGLGVTVERELMEDDQYDVIRRMPEALARSALITQETKSANVFNNGFDSSFTGGDGKELFATDHPLQGGGELRNELTTAADLDVTSYKQALIDISDFVDEASKAIQAKPKMLYVPSELQFDAKQIIQSQLLPGTADNDMNSVQNSAQVMVGHYLTDADAWFVITDIEGLMYFNRRAPELSRDNDFDSQSAKFVATFRCSVGWMDPRAAFGSPGA